MAMSHSMMARGNAIGLWIGTRAQRVRPEVLEGPDRDTVWRSTVLAQIPGVEKYEKRSGRTIPVARLHPVGPRVDAAAGDPRRD